MIKYNPVCGSHISEVCKIVADLANEKNETVSFEFNGITILLSPGDSPEDLEEEFWVRTQKRSDEYWTLERLQEKLNKELEDNLKLQTHFKTLENVNSLSELIQWFCKLETVSFIHAGLSSDQKQQLVEFCKKEFDITTNMNCLHGETKEEWNNHLIDYKISWLAGQALDGTLSIGCPHGIIHKFAKDFGIE